ncbi:MAG: response regulator [Deltaproteobacteria bacterium]|nr:response regulator [Deltaproteobacteria bacterium]
MNTEQEISKDLSVLVVDDIPSARKVVLRMLTSLGFKNLQEASSAAEARQKMQVLDVKLVIVDLHLKDALGTDLMGPPHPDNPAFVIITSDMDKSSFQRALEIGAVHYLLKPFSPASLIEKIACALAPPEEAAQAV